MTLLRILETCVPAVAFLLMLAVGLDVTREGLRQVASAWRMVAVATAAQAIALPAAAFLLVRIVPVDSRVAEYLLLVAACPGGGMSNVYVYLARANTPLSVALTATSCLLAVIVMPLVIGTYGILLGQSLAFALPVATLLVQLLVMAVIPVTLGAWIRDCRPDLERRHGPTLRRVSAIGVVVIVLVGLVQGSGSVDRSLGFGGLVSAGLVAAAMLEGWVFGALFGADRSDRFTLLVEFAVRSLAIAMVIEVTLLHHPDFVAFGALALLAQAGMLGLAIWFYGSGTRQIAATGAEPSRTRSS